jgi:glycosyltransferase involved in cell wall biosynthesis
MARKKSLHLCLLIDTWFPFVGGGQIHVKNLIKQLQSHHSVKVSLFHSPHHHIIIRALWNLWVIPQVMLAHQNQSFDLIHAHAFSAGIPAKILASFLNIPVIYTVHGSHLMDANKKGLKARLEKFLLTQIHYNQQISVTKSFLKYPNVNQNIAVINNGVNIREFDKVKVAKHKDFTFLYLGRDHPTKGLPILRRAFAQVKKQYPQVKLRLITGGLSGQKLIKAYKQAHAFVLPSLVEGQPISLLEAWAAQLPVIATKTSGVKEVAQNGHDAILIKPGSISQLAQALVKVFEMKPNQRQKLALTGYQKVKQQFTWSKIAAQTAQVYHRVLSQKSR